MSKGIGWLHFPTWGEITNPGRGGRSLNRWASHNSRVYEKGVRYLGNAGRPRSAADMRSSRRAETLRATAGELQLQGSGPSPEGQGATNPEGVSVVASLLGRATDNDPSAGSPTETLLRLLLPLNTTVWSSSRRPGRATRLAHSPRTSLKCSIGSSDGRCVQRAGT